MLVQNTFSTTPVEFLESHTGAEVMDLSERFPQAP
jgi:hypothetical protein